MTKIIISTLILLTISCQNNKNRESENFTNRLNKDSIYLVFRGTDSKPGNVVRDFNISDKYVSHVGFLINKKNKWEVQHVYHQKVNGTSLINTTLEDFLDKKQESIKYVCIYKVKFADKNSINKKIDYISKSPISFNLKLELNETNKMYCSQFIVRVLEDSNNKFETYTKVISHPQYKAVLKRDSIKYYPVDMFLSDDRFQKIYEKYYDSISK